MGNTQARVEREEMERKAIVYREIGRTIANSTNLVGLPDLATYDKAALAVGISAASMYLNDPALFRYMVKKS